ncbi:MAG: hypothetical protein ACE5J3_10735 [Methanosarcinales archaeon]
MSQVELIIDGDEIPLNDFVQSILASTINGAIQALSGINPDWKKVEIKIERD